MFQSPNYILGQNKFLVQKYVRSASKFFCQKKFGPKKNFGSKSKKKIGFKIFKENVWVRIFVLKNFGSAIFFEKMFGPKKSFSSKKIVGLKKILGLKKISGLKKCALHKYFLAQKNFGPKKFWIKKNFGSKKCWKNILDPKKVWV